MQRIFGTGTVPAFVRFRLLWDCTVLLVLLAAVSTPWHPAEAAPVCGHPPNELWASTYPCNDPAGVMVLATDASATEGTDATIDFEVTLSKPHPDSVVRMQWSTGQWPTAGHSVATAGEDYTAASGWLEFDVGETVKTISIALLDDSVSEGIETFYLRLSNVSSATFVGTLVGTNSQPTETLSIHGIILPDEDTDPPTVTVETWHPTTPPMSGAFVVLLRFSEAVTGLELSELEVINGVAVGIDNRSEALWSPVYNVSIVPDAGLNGNVTIRVPAGVAADALGNANTASAPLVVAARGNYSGPKAWLRCEGPSDPALWAPYAKGMSVEYGLEGLVAAGLIDITAISLTDENGTMAGGGLVACTGGFTGDNYCSQRLDVWDGMTGQLTLQILAGAANVRGIAGFVGLSSRSDPMLVAGYGWAVSAAGASATEGTDETIDFEVRLNAQDDCKAVKVDWATEDGTAIAGEDYTASSGTLTFKPGETVKTISIPVLDDAESDSGETFTLRLSNALGVEITDSVATGTILNDDPDLLTARFENVPESHNGSTAFTFELHFSESFRMRWRTIKDQAFTVTNGRITQAKRLDNPHAEGRPVWLANQGWRITIEPDGSGDVGITLPATTDCAATGAVCTEDDRPLSAAVAATVEMEAQSAQQSDQELTARFENVPESHDGSTAFTFELYFSESFRMRWRTIKDHAFTVTNGRITQAKRLDNPHAEGRPVWLANQGWRITIEPNGSGDVGITLPATTDCAATEAVCTTDGRPLSAGASETVQYVEPIALSLSVADAEVDEGPGATLDFVVSLSRAADHDITVYYDTRDGTATAGADYEPVNSSFVFVPGETERTISVVVLDDALDEGSETVNFRTWGARGLTPQQFADPYAIGTIRNTDKMPTAWIARFGRTVADHVLEAVQARREGAPASGMEASLAGQRIGIGILPESSGKDRAWVGSRSLSDWPNGETEAQRQNLDSRTITERDLLIGSSFSLAAQTKGSGLISIWGRGAVTRFDGREGDLTIDGEVASGMLGADWTAGAWKTGLLVSHSLGDGGYRGASAGAVSSTLTGIFPWARNALSDRLSVWGVAGYGEGMLTLEPEEQPRIRTDLDLWMAAAGLRGVLLDGGNDGPTLAAKTDAMIVRTSSDAVSGGIGNLAAADAEVTRLRLSLEGSQPFQLGQGATLTPSVEIGVRQDGGDAETGFGVDIGGGLTWSDTARGITAEFRGRGLLTHKADGLRERALSGSLSWDPTPASDSGPRASLTQTLGGVSSSGMDALLSRETIVGFAANDNGNDLQQRRLEARIGYGFAAFGGRFTSLPEFTVGRSDTGRDYSLGWRLVPSGNRLSGSVELSVEALRREVVNDGMAPEHQAGFRVNARF